MILKINREIVSEDNKVRLWFEGREGISFDDVDAAINWMDPTDNTIELMMNSLGGDCDEGFAIYDKLRSTGKEIKAVIQGHCGSMASVILLAASDRKAFPHATLRIHRPYLSFWTEHFDIADADSAKAQLEDLNKKILDIYEERTGTDRATLEAIMDEDRDMKPEEAKALGFIQEIMLPASASAYYNNFKPLNKTQSNMSKKSKIATAFLALGKALGLSGEDIEAKDYVLKTEDGSEINIDIDEGEEPKVGDPASPNGTFTLVDGRTVTIEGGVITEIKPAEKQEEGETKDDVIATLKAQAKSKDDVIATLKAQAKTEEDIKAIDFVKKAGGVDALARMQSTYKPDGRKTESNAHDVVEETMLQKELREKKEARATRK
jgi:ATP-dependent Clp protease protease subunit